VSEGDTLDETKSNIREAIEGYLEVVQGDNIEIGPDDEIFEVQV